MLSNNLRETGDRVPSFGSLSTYINPNKYVYTDGAAHFAAANKEYLTIPSNASLQTGDVDFEMGAWVYLDSLSAASILSKGDAGNVGGEYLLYYSSSANRFKFYIANASASAVVVADILGAPSATTWYFVRGWRNKTDGKIYISVNNGTANSADGLITDIGSNTFNIGYTGTGTSFMGGRIDSPYFTKRISTPAEATALYNAGAGRTYADLTAENGLDAFKAGLTSWWNLDEATGTRYDAHGDNDLTAAAVQLINATTLNGGFETAGAGSPDIFANWTETVAGTSTINNETAAPYAGTHACRFDIDASNSTANLQTTILVTGKSYRATLYAKADSGSPSIKFGHSANPDRIKNLTTSYALYTGDFVAASPVFWLGRSEAASKSLYIDNVTLESLGPTGTAGIAAGQAADHDDISKVIDAFGVPFIQTTLAKRPTWEAAGINSRPAFKCYSTGTSLKAIGDIVGTGNLTLFFVSRLSTYGGGGLGRIMDNGKFVIKAESGNSGILAVASNGVNSVFSANGSFLLNTTYVVSITRKSDGKVSIYINGTLSGNANQDSGTPEAGINTFLFNSTSEDRSLDGLIIPPFWYNAILTDTQRRRVEKYFGRLYGVTI